MASAPEPTPHMVTERPSIAGRLRETREASTLTVRALAARIDVSPSLISQIETGKVKPSLNTLYALAVELGVSVDEVLFGDGDGDGDTGDPVRRARSDASVQRAGSRAAVEAAPGVLWERLTGASEIGVDFLHLTYSPGATSVPEGRSHRHAGSEWGYVIRGTLHVEIGGECTVLHEGDSITYPSTAAHRLSNRGAQDLLAVWFVLGRPDGPATAAASRRRR
jgi:transcriptional regulator with XRE-family HTH domain